MSGKATEAIGEETQTIRLEMHRLMEQEGLSENKALARVLPDDRNRTKKLRQWKERGLWPVPASEIRLQQAVNTDIQLKPQAGDLSEKELLTRIRTLLNTIEPAERPIGATAKGRKSPLQTTMIAIRIPVSLDEGLKALGGAKSRHIERAIMLYLKILKEGKH